LTLTVTSLFWREQSIIGNWQSNDGNWQSLRSSNVKRRSTSRVVSRPGRNALSFDLCGDCVSSVHQTVATRAEREEATDFVGGTTERGVGGAIRDLRIADLGFGIADCGLRISDCGFRIWDNLGFGIWNWNWNLEFGNWNLEFGIWEYLGIGIWNLGIGIWI
jgi:hypothetical protein